MMQYLPGWLDAIDGDNDTVIWKGERFLKSNLDPLKMPWEKDARVSSFYLWNDYDKTKPCDAF
ncbi:hypothetical protein ACTACV_18695 [Pseudomonas syringae]|uniref:hypothetical protein n=1 Tax=Pseudomonas syringae TaxID=317 RepID=UPI003F74BD70